jgi:hypothetical protein
MRFLLQSFEADRLAGQPRIAAGGLDIPFPFPTLPALTGRTKKLIDCMV